MILELVFLLLLTACAFVACLILHNAVVIAWKCQRSNTKLKSMKMASGLSLIDGHLRSTLFKRHFIHDLKDLFDKYGKSFRVMMGTVPSVMTIDLDLIKRIIVDEKQIARTSPNTPFKEMEVDNILTCEPGQWVHIRRAYAPAFKSNKFTTPNVQRQIDGSVDKLIEAIELRLNASDGKGPAGAGQMSYELEIDDLLHRYSLDLILSCLYKQNKMIDFSSDKEPLVELIDRGFEEVMRNPMMWMTATFPILKPIVGWLMLQFHPQGKWRKTINGFIKLQTKLNLEARKELQKCKDAGEQVDENNFQLKDGSMFSRNMIDHVIDQFHDGKLTKQEYFHSTWFLFAASDKTSYDCLVSTIYQLAVDSRVQEKLRHSVKFEGMSSEYLGWVLNESMRLSPPTVLGCSRYLSQDIKLDDGCVIEAGTYVQTPLYAIHRLPEYWGQDANEFKPERFANTDHFHPFQFIPFGAGPRMCPGKEFALFEMKKVLCALLTRYKVDCEPMDMKYDAPYLLFLLPDKQTKIRFTKLTS